MKKWIAAIAVFFVCAGFLLPYEPVSAEEGLLSAQYRIELSSAAEMPPPLRSDAYYYTVSLYAGDDTEFQNPLCERMHETGYVFTKTGEYLLRYELVSAEDGTQQILSAKLFVEDSSKPIIETEGGYPEYAMIGDTIALLQGKASDNSGAALTCTIRIFRGDEEVTSQVKEGAFTFERSGEYRIEYSATDADGNEGTLTYSIEVSEKGDAPAGMPTWAIVLLSCGGALVVLGAGVLIFVKLRRKS